MFFSGTSDENRCLSLHTDGNSVSVRNVLFRVLYNVLCLFIKYTFHTLITMNKFQAEIVCDVATILCLKALELFELSHSFLLAMVLKAVATLELK